MPNLSHEEALKLIDEARLKEWTKLDLSANGLTEVPESLGSLSNLEVLWLHNNQLSAVPESLGRLSNLTQLYLSYNQLNAVPESLGRLSKLRVLWLQENRLGALPESLGDLSNITRLILNHNQLTTLPESLGRLSSLTIFSLDGNQLSALPESLGRLFNLTELFLRGNRLKSLPKSLGSLANLVTICLEDNPLNPVLQSAHDGGRAVLRSYLQGLVDEKKVEALYEAKLIFIGEGAAGKTSILKVLSGDVPSENELTTHGINVNIGDIECSHPTIVDTKIQFNAWDFGGQEVYRVTHQFYFSPHAIYVLVWEPRAGVAQGQVEDWLKMIRMRVGKNARVLIVSTYADGNRIARIDQSVFMRDFGDLIVGFLAVDSFAEDAVANDKVGFAELRRKIARAAAGLPQMGQEFNEDWLKARDEILAKEEPRISFDAFYETCRIHGLEEIDARSLALIMNDAGYIVYYGDNKKLKDDVILKPEWLTKAIGFVLEDKVTGENDGVLPDEHLPAIWGEHSIAHEERYDEKLYPFFVQLMEANEVLYRIHDVEASLIAQHVPQVRPRLPWFPETLDPETPTVTLACVMKEVPVGIVPRMIVRTHEYVVEQSAPEGVIRRLHWIKGMFLRHGNHGEALLELRANELFMQVRGPYPQYFLHILQSNLENLIANNWVGMKGRYHFTVPCPTVVNDEPCEGRFRIDALRNFQLNNIENTHCQSCFKTHSIQAMLLGMKAGAGDRKNETVKVKDLSLLLEAMASESKDGPRLYTVEELEGEGGIGKTKYRLDLWCEAEGCQHRVTEEDKGSYEFEEDDPWLVELKRSTRKWAKLLRIGLPLAGRFVDAVAGEGTMKDHEIASDIDAVAKSGGAVESYLSDGDEGPDELGRFEDIDRSRVLELHSFLRQHDPNHKKLGLNRKTSYTAGFQWLCPEHYRDNPPEIPTSSD
jgi:hypothetical protein